MQVHADARWAGIIGSLPDNAGIGLHLHADAGTFFTMGRTSAPPIKGELLLEARLRKCMSQADVQQACAERGLVIGQYQISKIERGVIRWPALRILPVLADVLGFDGVDELFDYEEAA
jgi:hypothetical protein